MLGYQSRRLEDDGSPKYLTFKDKGKNVQRLYYEVRPRRTGTVVLVEDALSAEKVGRYVDTVAVLTTTADAVLRDKLIHEYSHVIVWLDDDNIDVKKKQQQLRVMFDPYVKVTVLHTSKDPKRHSFSEIEEIIHGAPAVLPSSV
jgi:Ribonuclease G/E